MVRGTDIINFFCFRSSFDDVAIIKKIISVGVVLPLTTLISITILRDFSIVIVRTRVKDIIVFLVEGKGFGVLEDRKRIFLSSIVFDRVDMKRVGRPRKVIFCLRMGMARKVLVRIRDRLSVDTISDPVDSS